jgi:hypothetical protein
MRHRVAKLCEEPHIRPIRLPKNFWKRISRYIRSDASHQADLDVIAEALRQRRELNGEQIEALVGGVRASVRWAAS